jgi:hypothetical protein
MLQELSKYTRKREPYHASLIHALDTMIKSGNYRHSRMLQKLDLVRATDLNGTAEQLVDAFQKIYNYRAASSEKCFLRSPTLIS